MYKKYYLFVFLLLSLTHVGQVNFFEKGNKAIYWGITINGNTQNYRIDRKPISSLNDSFTNVYGESEPNFGLGVIGNLQINRFFDIRVVPNMTFGESTINMETNTNHLITRKMKTTMISIPLLLRFKTEPINDWRIFVLGGIRYDYNILSQVRPQGDLDRISLNKNGLSFEYGIGLQYFFPYFIFSPEIKFSHSITNMLSPDQSPVNSNLLNGIYPKYLVLSINFEG